MKRNRCGGGGGGSTRCIIGGGARWRWEHSGG